MDNDKNTVSKDVLKASMHWYLSGKDGFCAEHCDRFDLSAVQGFYPNKKIDELLRYENVRVVWLESNPDVFTVYPVGYTKNTKNIEIKQYAHHIKYWLTDVCHYSEFCEEINCATRMSETDRIYKVPRIADFLVDVQVPEGFEYRLKIYSYDLGVFDYESLMFPLRTWQGLEIVLTRKGTEKQEPDFPDKITVKYRSYNSTTMKQIQDKPVYVQNKQGEIFCINQGEYNRVEKDLLRTMPSILKKKPVQTTPDILKKVADNFNSQSSTPRLPSKTEYNPSTTSGTISLKQGLLNLITLQATSPELLTQVVSKITRHLPKLSEIHTLAVKKSSDNTDNNNANIIPRNTRYDFELNVLGEFIGLIARMNNDQVEYWINTFESE